MRWSTPIVLGVALVSAGLGFTVHLVLFPAPKETVTIVQLAPAAEPSPAPAPEEPPAEAPPPVVVIAPAEAPLPPPEPEPKKAQPEPPRLKRIEIPYEHLEGLAQRIIIPVTLNGRTTVPMALDTGAPGTIISTRLAQKLGVLREGESRLYTQAAGIGGSATAVLLILDSIAVGEARSEFVPATVTDSLSDAWEGLVGMDFLAGYTANIDTAQHVLVLTEQPPRASAPAGHDESWWRRTYQILAGQRTKWKSLHAALAERAARSEVSAGGDAEALKRLLAFTEAQDREAEVLASRLDRYASQHSVPLEWRRP